MSPEPEGRGGQRHWRGESPPPPEPVDPDEGPSRLQVLLAVEMFAVLSSIALPFLMRLRRGHLPVPFVEEPSLLTDMIGSFVMMHLLLVALALLLLASAAWERRKARRDTGRWGGGRGA